MGSIRTSVLADVIILSQLIHECENHYTLVWLNRRKKLDTGFYHGVCHPGRNVDRALNQQVVLATTRAPWLARSGA